MQYFTRLNKNLTKKNLRNTEKTQSLPKLCFYLFKTTGN